MIKFTDKAKEKVKFFLENANEQGMALRISVVERNKDGFQYHFGLDPYKNEHDDDVVVREGGFATRIDAKSAKWMKGATVDWLAKDGKEGFAVANPNQPIPTGSVDELKETIIHELKTIFDPEIPVNIYDLGLIYDIQIQEDKSVDVTMTLTAPNCPAAESLPADVKSKIENVPGIIKANVNITWEPTWTPAKMSEAAKLELNISA
ncbi:MAG: SUF system Fe-S cluster assembly protein [Proteobacteria bacterium]|jgi:FeS assembly SUF system protein|nr:SUF system Fe-S cluster assembly protein [Pseudomonadota bacterium]